MGEALRVGILGAGTVGREVARAFLERPDDLVADGGRPVELVGVAVRDLARARSGGLPDSLLTDAPAHLVADPNVDVVVELMGGEEPARTLILAALGAGKAVVTANKHVVAHHGPALEAAARAAAAPLRFEAAVGGGIPVLRPLAEDLATNRVERIRGIVNGTTNLILTTMARQGRSYADVLAEAQAAGYAEADPSGDVEGRDAANKLAILARLAFGRWVDPESIDRRPPSVDGQAAPGITAVTSDEIAAASALGHAIKLVADGVSASGRRIRASVRPTLVPLEDPLAQTSGVTNRIEIRARPLGSVALSGPGAGGEATASAVLGDVRAISLARGSTWEGLPAATEPMVTDAPAGDDERAADRGWFVFVPDAVRPERPSILDLATTTARTPAGTGVICDAPLAEVRATLARAAAKRTPPLTIYPVDRRMGGRSSVADGADGALATSAASVDRLPVGARA